MGFFQGLLFRLRALFDRDSLESEMEAEMRFHLEMKTQENLAQGMSPAEARRSARLTFGGLEGIKEECRVERHVAWLQDFTRDARSALRNLAKTPGFTTAAVLSLAIGVGASTVIFSIVDAVLLRPLPYPKAERMVIFNETTPHGERFSTSDANFLDFRLRNHTLTELAGAIYPPPQLSLVRGGEPVLLTGQAVTGSFFEVFAVEPVVGRTFTWEETAPGTVPRLIVLNFDTWKSQFGGDPDIAGRDVTLNGESWTVTGVMPANFQFPPETAAWIPYVPDPDFPRNDHRLEAVARLRDGVTFTQAREDLAAIAAQLEQEYPDTNEGWGTLLTPLPEWILGPEVRRTNVLLLVAVGLLLLLACANVSSLLLARATGRRAEIGLRLALGAGRGRILRQLLTESLVLSLLGAGTGAFLAFQAIPLVRALNPDALPRLDQMTMNGRVLLFALVLSVVTAALFGLTPAWQATRSSVVDAFKSGRNTDPRGRRLRDLLVVGELALAVILCVGAGLLFESFRHLQAVNPGFEVPDLFATEFTLPEDRYPEGSPQTAAFYRDVVERIGDLPAVTAAAAGMVNPFVGPSPSNTIGTPEALRPDEFVPVQWRSITPSYFSTLGVPVISGRAFRDEEAEFVAILSRSLAEKLWPGENAVDRQIRWRVPEGPLVKVVGVVGDVRDLSLEDEPVPTQYFHQAQVSWRNMSVLIRTEADPKTVAAAVRREIKEVDEYLGTPAVTSVAGNLRDATAGPRLNMSAVSLFAAIALLMAVIGVYGVVSYTVARRRQEIGVRVALGAGPRDVASLILRHGLSLALLGLLLGLGGAVALARFVASLLYDTPPLHLGIFAGVVLTLLVAGILASSAPAIRAMRIDSVKALRGE